MTLAVLLALAAPVARGWLIAFLAVGAPLMGAVALQLIGRLTGGAWVEAPGLRRLSGAAVWLWLIGLPVLIGARLIYPWSGGHATPQLKTYLSYGPFVVRSVVILGGWSLIAAVLPRWTGRVFAGAALAFWGLTVGFAAVDWSLSALPGWITSAAGMRLAVQQLMAALAVTLLLGADLDHRAEGDLCGLLIATALADAYLDLMIYLVPWYGDQAPQTAWFRLRDTLPWQVLTTTGLVVGDLAPIAVLAIGRGWLGRWTAPAAGALALFGYGLQWLWTELPLMGLSSLAPAVVATVLLVAGGLSWPKGRPVHAS